MENYEYWINVYSVVFSILIISLSLNSILFIKDKINKVLSFFIFTGLYSFILSYFFGKAFIGYTQQELLYKFIFEGYMAHLFLWKYIFINNFNHAYCINNKSLFKKKISGKY